MEYREYLARAPGIPEKRLGIFGEVHMYTREESILADMIIESSYKNIAIEGNDYKNQKFTRLDILKEIAYIPLSIAHIPSLINICLNQNRSMFNDTLKDYAENYSHRVKNKKITRFNDCSKQYIDFKRKCAAIPLALVSLPLTLVGITKGLIKKIRKSENNSSYNIESLLTRYETPPKNRILKFMINIDKRDRLMAGKSAEILRTSSDLLINCGAGHIPGIVENLESMFELEETRKIIMEDNRIVYFYDSRPDLPFLDSKANIFSYGSKSIAY